MSTPSVVLPGYPPRGGTRSGTPPGGYPDPPGGYPDPPGGGTQSGTPRGGTQSGTPQGGTRPPRGGGVTRSGTPRGGVPDRVPPLPHGILGNVAKHYGIWVPPLWTDRWMDGRTDACQNITFPRTPYAGGNNDISSNNEFWVCENRLNKWTQSFLILNILCIRSCFSVITQCCQICQIWHFLCFSLSFFYLFWHISSLSIVAFPTKFNSDPNKGNKRKYIVGRNVNLMLPSWKTSIK